MFETETSIFCERIEDGLPSLEFDMLGPYRAERRIHEVATVSPMRAPELMATFIEAYGQVGKHYARLELELQRAYSRSERKRAILMLDEVPEFVKQKGWGSGRSPLGSEDVREAYVNRDDEYGKIQDKIAAFKATKELMAIKMKTFDQAYTAIKKILDTTRMGPTANMNGVIPEEAEAGDTVQEEAGIATVQGRFGIPRY